MRILLDASNLGATGPEVLCRNLVPLLADKAPNDEFILLLPSSKSGDDWGLPANVCVSSVRRLRVQEVSRMWDINFGLSRLCQISKADVYFTLGDIGPVRLSIPHVIYLHQPYLVYTEPELDASLPQFEKIKLRYQRWHFFRSVSKANTVIVQTRVMKERLVKLYQLPDEKVKIIPPPMPFHLQGLRDRKTEEGASKRFGQHSLNLLFLATYYAHKNHVILPAVIKELRQRNLSGKVHFYLTLDGDRRREETALLKTLMTESDMATNLGRLSPDEVASIFHNADALFMPTLVETFGLIYLEALATRKPILTSDRDFSRHICGDLAIYFDPHDPDSIADAIERLLTEREVFQNKVNIEADRQIAAVSGSAEGNAKAILDILKNSLLKKKGYAVG